MKRTSIKITIIFLCAFVTVINFFIQPALSQSDYGTQITFDGNDKWLLDWSPDGKWITYTSREYHSNIIVIPAEGGEEINLSTNFRGVSNYPSFTSDSKAVSFSNDNANNNWSIGSITIETMGYSPVRANAMMGAWSHRGQYFAYRIPSTSGLILFDTVSSESRIIYSDGNTYGVPCFSPDDAFVITTLEAQGSSRRLFKIPVEGGEPEKLTFHGELQDWFPDYSPDGKWILYTHLDIDLYNNPNLQGHAHKLYILNTETGESEPVFPELESSHWNGSFSSDGSKICFLLKVGGVNEVFIADLPSLLITPREIDFGTVDFSRVHHKQLTLKNIRSSTPLTIDNITCDNEYFTFSPVSGVIAPGDSLVITVTFSPDDFGEQSAIITIQSGDIINTLPVSGTGLGKVLRETSLVEGEKLYYRSIKIITWEYCLVENITIEYSADDGETWHLVGSNIPVLNNKYFWRVPNISLTDCLLKLSDSADPSFFTISDSFVVDNVIPPSAESRLVINEVMSSNNTILTDKDGEYSDWIELLNFGDTPIVLTDYGLSDRPSNSYKWIFPDIVINPGQYLIIFASGKDLKAPENSYLHTSFKVNATGETLQLTDSSGNICDSVETGFIQTDESLGRQPDESSNWVYFTEPTPGEGNYTTGREYAASVMASIPGGLYDNIVTVELSVNSSNAKIRYTLDGSEPTATSTKYVNPISIDKTSVLRARAFEDGFLPGKINTNTYLINEQTTLPVVSLSTDPDNFFDDEIGIYVNYYKNWERQVHIEFFEPNGTFGFEIDAGASIYGQGTRGYPEKTLAIYLRGKYGYESVNYQ
ncbi:MAG: DUF1573 domain-containing protein, partial [Candidatus Latescibacteria bacterium]|nr:DUF1573 domain-containing protein [Candidatus Latescibacterota bacterium]